MFIPLLPMFMICLDCKRPFPICECEKSEESSDEEPEEDYDI